MSGRRWEVSLSEEDWAIVLEILDSKERTLRKQSETIRNSGYGKVTTLAKSENLFRRADEIQTIINTINENAS